jgi:hypothetical protein
MRSGRVVDPIAWFFVFREFRFSLREHGKKEAQIAGQTEVAARPDRSVATDQPAKV